MFTRLRTLEEERGVEALKAYAVRTSKSDVKRFLRQMEYKKLPMHLKRIKPCGTGLLVLIDLVQDDDSLEKVTDLVTKMTREGFGPGPSSVDPMSLIEQVDVPKHQPHTDTQYVESTLLWPCIRLQTPIEDLDLKYIKRMVEILRSRESTLAVCTGACIIADGENVVSIHKDTDNILGHSILKAVEEVSKAQVSYLCTGLDAFVLKEPCLSCSMAFVHGRIKRVFCIGNTLGGPFSGLKINYHRSLNHRYLVYFMDNDHGTHSGR